jgi:hypothetical protein
MKQFLFSLLMAYASVGFSQSLTIDKVDDFTGNVTRKTEYYEIGSSTAGQLYCAAARLGDIVFIELWTSAKQGCAGAVDNYVHFLFEDGDTYRNDKDENKVTCEERASCYYVVTADDFAGEPTKKIRFKMSDGYVDYDWSGSYSISSLIAAVQ